MKVKYEDLKCVCCDKVHVNSLLMDVRDEAEKNYVICLGCAKDIHKFLSSIIGE